MQTWDPDDLRVTPPADRTVHVRANMVTSIDGAGAFDPGPEAEPGQESGPVSGPLSGPEDMRLFQVLRSVADVVLVGAGTVRAENYGPVTLPEDLLRWRLSHDLGPAPRLAVLSGRLSVPPDARAFTTKADDPPTMVLTTQRAPADRLRALQRVAEVVPLPDLSPATVTGALAERGLTRIHLEGGPSTLGDFLAADALDELRLTLAPVVAGGAQQASAAGAGGRIVTGRPLRGPLRMRLNSCDRRGDFLFLSYVRSPVGDRG